ncbi:glycosyltransferase family 2 protein [Saccharicrinis sp. FJH54]|uniref:glycosyltransferase family 2 protein n=1 Tax=Saccharicrinis sp. FJH54 TaxID=3344665 RepID=UPI0035D471F0
MVKVLVLMSTYNGSRYLKQQLDSILSQQDVEIYCLIRDDGSTDATLEILNTYKRKNAHIEIFTGNNIGYKQSFFELINKAGKFDYYAFSDQDDLWLNNKLYVATEKIKSSEIPTLYFSNCYLTDENLVKTGLLHPSGKVKVPEQEMAITQGFVHGCTMVVNYASMKIIKSNIPKITVAHDYWIPLLHVYLGKIVYDPEPCILYRQHQTNVFGVNKSIYTIITTKFRELKDESNFYSKVISEILAGYKDQLDSTLQNKLFKILSLNTKISGRLKLCMHPLLKRNTIKGTLFLKFQILSGRF